ncbi:MAG: sugar phosphate isomerase/epimerase [Planctomycetota bacterium]|nr:MAG: sugar phosphate isomerase/epimerase [Planctomycetota bacterium]
MTPNLIACRLSSYGKYQNRGWSHLPVIGIHHVEIHIPSPDTQNTIRKKLKTNNLTVSSMQASCNIQKDDAVELMKPQLEICSEFGAEICLICIKADKTDRSIIWERLRKIGDLAAQYSITIVIETHPDLMTNSRTALETLTTVNHPNIRVNFDTGNVYYYNKNLDAVDELSKIIDYVASIHIKDSNGRYQEWDFPTLGTGIVDFPTIFRLTKGHGFTGPFTIELQGTEGVKLDEAGQLRQVTDSVAYLRKIDTLMNEA